MDVGEERLCPIHAGIYRRAIGGVFVRTVRGSHLGGVPVEHFFCHPTRPNVLHDTAGRVILHYVPKYHLHQLSHRLFHAVRNVGSNRASFFLRLFNSVVG